MTSFLDCKGLLRLYAIAFVLLMSFGVLAHGQAKTEMEVKQSAGTSGAVTTTVTTTTTVDSPPPSAEDDHILHLPECSLAKTNTTCKLIVDRANPVAPPAVQMYSGQRLVVIVENPLPYERYFLDFASGQAAVSPDIGASIVQAMLPSLQKANPLFVAKAPAKGSCAAANEELGRNQKGGTLEANIDGAQTCASSLISDAKAIYVALEPYVATDSLVAALATPPPSKSLQDISKEIDTFLANEASLSGGITVAGNNHKEARDAAAAMQLSQLQKAMDAIAADLSGYKQRIADLEPVYVNGTDRCNKWVKKTGAPLCVRVSSRRDDLTIYRKEVSRTVTYSLDVLNMVANGQEAIPDPTKKKALASIALNFADRPTKGFLTGAPYTSYRWETSAGVWFSWLPNRSFSATPVYTGPTVTDNTITQSAIRPTVVPFAAGNYRLSNDIGWSRWKSDLYVTGAIGINPNTVSADYAAGLSLSWRTLLVSGLCHFGHDTQLTQGLYPNESLGASFNSTLSTQSFWTHAAAIGVSIRIPTLSGR